jgi:transcriptional regulator with XRE-family HTH domain
VSPRGCYGSGWMSDPPRLGELLRKAREAHNLSLRKLAERVGVSPPFMSDIEHGRRWPGPEVADRLADALHITRKEFDAADERPKSLLARVEALERRVRELERRPQGPLVLD